MMKKGGELGKAEGEAFGGGGAESDVAQFAARAGGFAIEVEMGVRDGEDIGGIGELANEIEHGAMARGACGAEREAENGAKMILKLAGNRALDGPVPGIVDARGHFVGEELALMFKKFDGQHADIF